MSSTEASRENASDGERRLGPAAKAGLALLVLFDFLVVRLRVSRRPLPDLARRLGGPARVRTPALAPRRLGRIVDRVLRLGPYRPRCMVLSLVFYRLLRRQGTDAEVVIGLPPAAESHHAHAWVEVEGEVVGPPPGRMGHAEMARYGA